MTIQPASIIRLALIGKRPQLSFPRLAETSEAKPSHQRDVYLLDPKKPVRCPVYQRAALGAANRIAGPALIQEFGTTTVLFEQDACTVAPSGELVVSVGGAC